MIRPRDTSTHSPGTEGASGEANYDLEALHSVSNRRRSLGAYYTPEPIADAVSSWAITDPEFAVLDPSFGGCSFLRSAVTRLSELGAVRPGSQVFGIDVDPATSPYVDALAPLGVPNQNLKYEDFFAVTPDCFPKRFDAVVGNPPYIRHHRLDSETLERARACAEAENISLDGRSDAWAYFVAHSLSFLKQGGRLALLLPGSVLHADYARPLREELSTRFRNVELIQLRERLFDARESTTVLLADGFRKGTSSVGLRRVRAASELSALLRDHEWAEPSLRNSLGANAALLSSDARQLLNNLMASTRVIRLGALTDIGIGVVTGANAFFVRREDEVLTFRSKGVTTVPVLPSSRHLKGATWRKPDQQELATAGARVHLLEFPTRLPTDGWLADLIEDAEEEGLSNRSHCRKRDPWYVLDDLDAPHAFLGYMAGIPRGLVLNHARATCTNSVHRIRFASGAWESRYSVVASSWSNLWRLALEIRGRPYGGGVLKIEPSAAKVLPVVSNIPRARALLSDIDRAARAGDLMRARSIADDAVLRGELGLSRQDVAVLRAAADELQNARTVFSART